MRSSRIIWDAILMGCLWVKGNQVRPSLTWSRQQILLTVKIADLCVERFGACIRSFTFSFKAYRNIFRSEFASGSNTYGNKQEQYYAKMYNAPPKSRPRDRSRKSSPPAGVPRNLYLPSVPNSIALYQLTSFR